MSHVYQITAKYQTAYVVEEDPGKALTVFMQNKDKLAIDSECVRIPRLPEGEEFLR